jgi:integrase
MTLSVKKIERLRDRGRYRDANGLYLQVTEDGVRSWVFRYELNKQRRWMGLGPLHAINLDEARERARKARRQLLDGIDPIAARKAERAAQALEAAKAITFQQASQEYFDQHSPKWRNAKHRDQYMTTLESYVFPKIGRLSVSAIDTGLVLKCIEPIWATKTETASRVRGRIESILDWSTVRGYRTGENPARWKGHLANVLPARGQIAKQEHHAALAYADIPEFIAKLRTKEGFAASALEFTILTAARTGETIGATWREIDFKAKIWTVPAGRIKGGHEHRVPLSDRAIAILKAMPREAEFVFPGSLKAGTPLSNTALNQLLKRMGYAVTVHGFRSTFRDWAAERTGYPNHIVEMALAHKIGNKVEAAYRRGDLIEKRARLMADWAKYADKGISSAKVVSLR